MLGQEHLTMRLVRLRAAEEWRQRAGLTFMFPKAGRGSYLWARQVRALRPGDVAVIGGEPQGKVCVIEGDELVFWAFSLCLEHLFPLFAADEIALLQAVSDGLKGVRLHPASARLAAECHRLIAELPPQFNLDHRSQLLRVAATILSEEFKTARRQQVGYVRAEEHLVQAFERLSTEQLLKLSVDELAEKFGCSRRHLNRLFHRHFGFSIIGLRMELRLLKAVSLLRDPSAKVIHVAEQAGFNHLGLFNSCFRRRFGTSPGQWRKRAAQGQESGAELMPANKECPMHSNGLCPWLCEVNGAEPTAPKAGSARQPAPGWPNSGPVAAPARSAGSADPSNGARLGACEVAFSPNPEAKSPAAVLLERCSRL